MDVRWALGSGTEANRAAYLQGHLPGAAFLDLESALSGPVAPDRRGGRHPMPEREQVQGALRSAGVRAGHPVVFYDARPSLGAARAWWVARYHGVGDSRVLDGGLAAWEAASLPVQAGPVHEIVGSGDTLLVGTVTPVDEPVAEKIAALPGIASAVRTDEGLLIRLDADGTAPRLVAELVRLEVPVASVGPHRRLEDAFLTLIGGSA